MQGRNEQHAGFSANQLQPTTWEMQAPRGGLSIPVLYPGRYVWLVFLSGLDAVLTWCVLSLEGSELNPLGNWIFIHFDFGGMVVFKFLLITVVLLICEYVGRRRNELGHNLAMWCLWIAITPVLIAFAQLLPSAADLGLWLI